MTKDISDPLDDDELALLDAFLLDRLDEETAERISAAGGDEGILDVSELDGLLTAIVSGPNPIMPSQWLPQVWGAESPKWESPTEYEAILGLLMRHQNSIIETLLYAPSDFEPMFNHQDVDGETHLIVDEWCVGYMRGVALDADAWTQGDPEITTLLRPIRLWGTEEGWDLVDKMSEADQTRERSAIASAVRSLHQYWQARDPAAT